jgi:cytochrome c553
MKATSGFLVTWGLLAAFALAWVPALAADAPPGAASCSGCHATNAAAETPVPKIHGRNADETVALMAQFRDGTKPSTIMGRLAKGFSDEETRAIATWLASQR